MKADMQPIGCGLLPPRGLCEEVLCFHGVRTGYRYKIFLPFGLPAESSRQRSYRDLLALSVRSLRSRIVRGESHVFIVSADVEIICKIERNIFGSGTRLYGAGLKAPETFEVWEVGGFPRLSVEILRLRSGQAVGRPAPR